MGKRKHSTLQQTIPQKHRFYNSRHTLKHSCIAFLFGVENKVFCQQCYAVHRNSVCSLDYGNLDSVYTREDLIASCTFNELCDDLAFNSGPCLVAVKGSCCRYHYCYNRQLFLDEIHFSSFYLWMSVEGQHGNQWWYKS